MAIENKKETRIPLTTVFECFFALISLIVYVLVGFDIVNAKNGSSIVLLFLSSTCFMMSYIFSCLKLVHLGDKIIPKAIRYVIRNDRSSSHIKESENLSSIRRDKILTALFGVTFLSLVLTLILTVIVGGIVYRGRYHIYVTIGLGLVALMNLTATSIIIRQTVRVINYIRGVNQKHKGVFGENVQNQGDGGKKIEEVIKRLKIRAYMVCIGESGGVFLHAAGIFTPLPWYIIVALFAFSSIGEIGSTILYMPPSMRMFGGTDSSKSFKLITDPSNRNNKLVSSPKSDRNLPAPPADTGHSSSAVNPVV